MILDHGTNFPRSRSSCGSPACRFADNLEVPHEPVLNEFVRLKRLPSTRRIAFDIGNPVKDIPEPFLGVSHKGDASLIMRSRIRALSPRSVTTSTSRPNISLSSISSPPMSSRVRPGSISTRKSTSLSGRASPRTTEPKTRTLWAPCRAAIRRISCYEFFNSHDI